MLSNKEKKNKIVFDKKYKNKFEEDYFENPNKEEEEKKEKENKTKYRTELCKYYEINGKCKFGENCIFAHGKNNLRENLLKKSGYKKKPCVNFFDKGFCMYGNRCHFSHDLKFENKNYLKEKINVFSYKFLFNELNHFVYDNNDKNIILNIKKKPRLKVFKKFVKVKKSVFKKKKNYIDEILERNNFNNKK